MILIHPFEPIHKGDVWERTNPMRFEAIQILDGNSQYTDAYFKKGDSRYKQRYGIKYQARLSDGLRTTIMYMTEIELRNGYKKSNSVVLKAWFDSWSQYNKETTFRFV
jgi:hypothetical protein